MTEQGDLGFEVEEAHEAPKPVTKPATRGRRKSEGGKSADKSGDKLGGEKNCSELRKQMLLDLVERDALTARTTSLVPRAFLQASLPYRQLRDKDGNPVKYLERQTPFLNMMISTVDREGLPYGTLPRMLLAYITNQAVITRSQDIELGESVSDIMRTFGLQVSGGKNGTISRFKKQLSLLLNTLFRFEWHDTKEAGDYELSVQQTKLFVAFENQLKFEARPKNGSADEAQVVYRVRLSKPFFDELCNSPVPVDFRQLIALQNSALAMDLYSFLTYRVFQLKKPVTISWEALMKQFLLNVDRPSDFRRQIRAALKKVQEVYPGIKFETDTKYGLTIFPSPTAVPPLKTRKRISRKIQPTEDFVSEAPAESAQAEKPAESARPAERVDPKLKSKK